MTSKRTFYKTTITFEVLSEEPLPGNITLADIDEMTDDGECSGRWIDTQVEELGGPAAAARLLYHNSDPEFFQLDEDGNDEEDGGDE